MFQFLNCGNWGGGTERQDSHDALVDNNEDSLHHLHDCLKATYIPPTRWGISREDLTFFQKEVAEYHKAQKIPKGPEKYNIAPHAGAKKPSWGHDDPKIGPSIYQVCDHYIKPVTKERAEGMSWALMRNKDKGGLEVDCFATHSWNEGVWEFIKKVRQSWPATSKGLYICFLSNPQFGVKQLLMGGLKKSPFYQCLMNSKTMIVIPNHKASIYCRKWCVYEAYLAQDLAHENKMHIVLPWLEEWWKVVLEVLPAFMFGVGGFFYWIFAAP